MAKLTDIRAGLAARVATISGVITSATIPDSIPAEPFFIVAPELHGEFGDPHPVQGDGVTWYLLLRGYVSRWDAPNAQLALDPYLDVDGAQSVLYAIESDPTLGGLAGVNAIVTGVQGYGKYTVAGTDYLGAEWKILVYA